MSIGNCGIPPESVSEAFLNAQPLIAEEIYDLSIQTPKWMRDLYLVKDWPEGAGTMMEQLVFRGGRPQITRGFQDWKQKGNNTGCDPCDGPDCSYNWTMFGGHGFERKVTTLMSKEFRSPSYCVNEIQTTAHFKEVFGKIVENLYSQTDFYKEFNIGQNILTGLAKKYVVDSGGAKFNRNNPYVYRNTNAVILSTLNINMLEFFYEQMRRIPDVIPYDVVDGQPIYSMIVGSQMMSHLFRDDANLRQDVRFSGLANDLVMKYNFMSVVRGMFIVAPTLYPRRFNIVANAPVEVLPFVNDVPAEVGSYTYLNPAYEAATHEEVILHGKWPFTIFQQPTVSTLGGGSTFGPSFSFMNSWMWINPMTECDPFRRVGYFATEASIGVSQQFSEGIYGILVTRPKVTTMAMYTPVGVCPVAEPTCNNEVPAAACPCPVVLSVTKDPFTALTYDFTLASPVTGVATDPISFTYDSGAILTGIIADISADGFTAKVTVTEEILNPNCAGIISVNCVNAELCSATVISGCECTLLEVTGEDPVEGVVETIQLKLKLSNAIKADTAADVVVAQFEGTCDPVTGLPVVANLVVVSVDEANIEWTFEYQTPPAAGTNCGLMSIPTNICVPTATDAACPACTFGPAFVACS